MERMVGLRDECACTVNLYRVAYNIKDLTRSVGLLGMALQQVDFLFSRLCHVYSLCPRLKGVVLRDFGFRKVWPPSGAQRHQGSELCKMIGQRRDVPGLPGSSCPSPTPHQAPCILQCDHQCSQDLDGATYLS